MNWFINDRTCESWFVEMRPVLLLIIDEWPRTFWCLEVSESNFMINPWNELMHRSRQLMNRARSTMTNQEVLRARWMWAEVPRHLWNQVNGDTLIHQWLKQSGVVWPTG